MIVWALSKIRGYCPQVLRHFEFTPGYGSLRQYKFECIITTYELVLKVWRPTPSLFILV